MSDPICPTFAAGTFSIISTSGIGDVNGDLTVIPCTTVNSFNNQWANGVVTQSIAPTY